jgi:hypothetical protein
LTHDQFLSSRWIDVAVGFRLELMTGGTPNRRTRPCRRTAARNDYAHLQATGDAARGPNGHAIRRRDIFCGALF